MIRKLFTLLLLCSTALTTFAQQTPEKFVRETNYQLYLPDNYNQDTSKRLPLMLFLHGSGETGTEVNKVKVNGPPKMIAQGKKFPFIVVSPQASHYNWDENELYDMLTSIMKKYRVDKNRVYLTGLSMGGFGSWKLAIKHPEMFAAVVPICGGGDTTDIYRLRNTAVWAFHGAKDDVVLPSQSISMVNALKKYNPKAKLTIYPEANHNSWEVTYNNDSLYTWMLQQTRFTYKQANIKQKYLDKYAGTYVNTRNDTVKISAEKGCLMAIPREQKHVELKPAADDLFFIEADYPVDIQFTKRGKDEVFILSDEKQVVFKKVSK
jgi:predicted esterase